MTATKLTERQRKFAEENHRILEDFLKYRELPTDEFYDIVVFGFLKAVRLYDEREDLRRFTFKTIAKNQMRWCLGDYFIKQKKQAFAETILSLDAPISQYPDMTLGDTIADESVNVCEQICEKLSPTRMEYRLLHISPSAHRSFRIAA